MITLGLSRVPWWKLRQPLLEVESLNFDATRGPLPFTPVSHVRMTLVVNIPTNVRCHAPICPATVAAIRRALEAVLDVRALPIEDTVYVEWVNDPIIAERTDG